MSTKFDKELAHYLPLGDGTFAPVVVLESVDSAEAMLVIPKENFRRLRQGYREVNGQMVPVLAVVGAAGEAAVQATRSADSTAVQADSGTTIPISGTRNFTVPTGLNGFNAQLLRADAGTLTVLPGAGVTFYYNGATVPNLTVTGKYNWILIQPGLVANEYILSRNTGA